MFTLTRVKIRVFLATLVLSLLLVAPFSSPVYASDCDTVTSTLCGG